MVVTVQEKNAVKKSRNSSIELLKILAIILIVVSHAAPLYGDNTAISYIDLTKATKDVSEFILIIIRTLGQVGNIIFVMCSAYFLYRFKKCKTEKNIIYFVRLFYYINVIFISLYDMFR